MIPKDEDHTVALTIASTLLALAFLVLVYVVPKFEAIFRDMLPGKPLPALTETIVGVSRLIAGLPGLIALPFILMAIAVGFTRRGSAVTANLAYAAIALMLLFLAMAAMGLYIPFVTILSGLSHP